MSAASLWKPVILPAAAVVFLALYPQISLWMARGSDWNGAYAVSNYDETAYSAYSAALIAGHERKFDPFLERPEASESLYSIQFVPAYLIAVPARVLGLSASSAFIILGLLIGLASVIALYWLLRSVTADPAASACGTLIVLCLGTAAAFQGELRYLAEGNVLVDYLPFLRRYQPGVGFPLFFVFCSLCWRAFDQESVRRSAAIAAGSGALFAVLVFTYFYLWTAAAVWLFCFAALSYVLKGFDRRSVFTSSAVIAVIAAAALVPYFMMLAGRSANIDSVQLLTFSRSPNLSSPVLWLGLLIAAGIAVCVRAGKIEASYRAVAIAGAFAITPVFLLNQQVITGRSLQPVHYELFIANYLVLTAAAILLWIALRDAGGRKLLLYAAVFAFGWGIFEAAGSARRNADANFVRDESFAAFRYIAAQRDAAGQPPVILATNFVTADLVPTALDARSLWGPHTSSAGGIDIAENKRLFYLYLYFSGYTPDDLRQALRDNVFEVRAAVFGSERALPSLAAGSSAVTDPEIAAEVLKFSNFCRSLDERSAYAPALSYIIVPADAEPDHTDLDRWYERDAGHAFKLLKVYRLKPRSAG